MNNVITTREDNSLVKASFAITLGLITTTMLAGIVGINTISASADDSFTDTISLDVAAVCTMEASVSGTTHSGTLLPGQFTGDIGLTNVNASCNDTGGYAVYAIGYTNNEYGNTNLINTTDATNTIPTGTTTGSNSNWSMKLGQGTGDSATITGQTSGDTEDFYNNYHIVPSTYTKVAAKPSATDPTITGTAFTTTYGAYISSTQAAGTYTGQVKYTLVHPNTAPAPFVPQPVVTNPGYISYNPNAPTTESPDTMDDQAITNTATSAELWASNFKRQGYGFAGWNTEPDYSGTSYGPNETITFTAGQYSGTNPGLSLYAIWIKSAGDLQGWTGCSSLTKANEATNILTQSLTALTDTRDQQTYAVARLADGNCWMIENLRLDNQYTTSSTDIAKAQGYNSSFIGLANPETANFSDSTTANSLYSTDGSTSAPTITGSIQGYRFPRYNNQNTATPATNMTAWDNNSNTYSVGNWYTWAAAIADTSNYASGTHNTTSICPTGWHIPSGGSASAEYGALDVAMGGTGATQSTTEASMRWRKYPQNFVYSGYFNGGSPRSRGSNGVYWSSTVNIGGSSYSLSLDSSSVFPGTHNYREYLGSSVRCLASAP